MSMSSHTMLPRAEGPPRAERHAARARRARAWAWPVRLALLACLGLAIWQEPRLSPWVHARMQYAVTYAEAALEGAPRPGAALATLGGGATSRKDGGFAAWIVEAMTP